MIDFLKDESGLNASNSDMCVCGAFDLSVRQAMKSRTRVSLQVVEGKKVSVCCVPSCGSVDIKAEKHDFTWEVICDSIGIDLQVTFHCVQIIISKCIDCKICGVLHRHCSQNFVSCPDSKSVESYPQDTDAFSGTIKDRDQICYILL